MMHGENHLILKRRTLIPEGEQDGAQG